MPPPRKTLVGKDFRKLVRERGQYSFAKQTYKNLTSYRLNVLTTSKKAAFTLAEVLITLGIIGVVAAITMPTLIQNHQKKTASTRLKKDYSIVSNAFLLAQNNESEIIIPHSGSHRGMMNEFLNKYFIPYVNIGKNYGWMGFKDFYNDNSFNASHGGHFIGLNDGSVLAFAFVGQLDEDNKLIYRNNILDCIIDVNGKAKPNKSGRDIFYIRMQNNKINMNCSYDKRDDLITQCKASQNVQGWKIGVGCCGKLIQTDGWEIKDDYPW